MKQTVVLIEPGLAARHYWQDLWRYRELFIVLAWRDVSVRYKQTAFGVAWAILQPLLTMAVFTFVFSRVAKLPTVGSAPYALMVFAGLLPWQLFASALAGAANSVVGNSSLISKVYFPRLIIPAAAVVVSLIDLLVSLGLLAAMMAWYRFMPGWQIITLPFFVLMAFLCSLGPGLLITSMNVRFRDFRYVIPFIIQFGLYVSPVGFNSQIVPEQWRFLYSLNPMVGVIDGFRWAILGAQAELRVSSLLTSGTVIALFLWAGIRQFRRTERSFADLV